MRALRLSTFALALSWCVAASAQTNDRSVSSEWPTRITNCSPELTQALPSVVHLEVDVLLRERGPASPPDDVGIHCEGDNARISVRLAGTTRDTTIDLTPLAAQHRARAIGLAAAELLHSLANRDDESKPPPTPAAPSAPPPQLPPPPSKPESPARPPAAALLVGALGEWLGKPATPLFGARLGLRYPLNRVLVPALSADASFGSATTPSARVAATSLSAALHLYFETTALDLRWSAGPGARIGWAALVGHPSPESGLDGRTLSGAWGGPELRARVAYGGAAKHSPLLALEVGAGAITLPLRGTRDGADPVYELTGPWLSVCLEVGVEL